MKYSLAITLIFISFITGEVLGTYEARERHNKIVTESIVQAKLEAAQTCVESITVLADRMRKLYDQRSQPEVYTR